MRDAIAQLAPSRIREVANAALGRDDVLPFWFGESDEVTPQVVRDAAASSLARGETFYSHNLGLPALREALAAYVSRWHQPVDVPRIAVTSSGVSGLMLAMQLLLDAGDEVVAVVPVWPNLTAQPAILGASVVRVPLVVTQGAWRLDMGRLLASITPTTRLLLINAPNNPTGWTLTRAEQQTILDHCRRTGTWLLADEVYERLWYGSEAVAPSFLDLAQPDDRLIVAHSFSKSFLMTGWRLGWLVLPPGHDAALAKLVEFNTSCAPVFVQQGGLAALAHEAELVPPLVAHMRACRDRLVAGLATLPGMELALPQGGMYAFLRLPGVSDQSLGFAKRLVTEHGLGLAPGVAFGDEAEGWLRWCFASRDLSRLDDGVGRLRAALHL
jgi:aspartate/methionine/tyrosine aminotransferase